jgi:hypothetical protein
MQFNDKHSFDKPAASVLKMFSDRAYFERKYRELGYRDIEVLEHALDARRFRITVRYTAPNSAPVPDFAKKFLGQTNSVTQSDTWDLEKRTGRLGQHPEVDGVLRHPAAGRQAGAAGRRRHPGQGQGRPRQVAGNPRGLLKVPRRPTMAR